MQEYPNQPIKALKDYSSAKSSLPTGNNLLEILNQIKASLSHTSGDMVISNEAPSYCPPNKSWKMAQVWVKCARPRDCGNKSDALPNRIVEGKKHRGRPFKLLQENNEGMEDHQSAVDPIDHFACSHGSIATKREIKAAEKSENLLAKSLQPTDSMTYQKWSPMV